MQISAGGLPVELQFLDPDASAWFSPYALLHEAAVPAAVAAVSERQLSNASELYEPGSSSAYIEYMELAPACSNVLLSRGITVFHSVAVLYEGRSFLLTAPSGTGKSTQYVNWKRLLGDRVKVICGDKPFLRFENGGVTVYTSPWRGKENIGCLESAPLGGIIYLTKADLNDIRRIPDTLAAKLLYRQIIFYPDTEELITLAAGLSGRLAQSVPVWQLRNVGDLASAALTVETVRKALNL